MTKLVYPPATKQEVLSVFFLDEPTEYRDIIAGVVHRRLKHERLTGESYRIAYELDEGKSVFVALSELMGEGKIRGPLVGFTFSRVLP